MVIKSTFVHSGWSYGKGDDQYGNESPGQQLIWKKRWKIRVKTRKMNMTKRCAVNNKTNNKPQTKDGQQSIRKASANPTLRTTRTQALTQ
jgi:hypothetical protein